MKHSQQKMETISVKILLNSDGSSAHLLSVNVKILLNFDGNGVQNVHCRHALYRAKSRICAEFYPLVYITTLTFKYDLSDRAPWLNLIKTVITSY